MNNRCEKYQMNTIRILILPVTLCFLFLFSCGEDAGTSGSGTQVEQVDIYTHHITYLLPVLDNQIHIDSISADSAVISWDTSSNNCWHRVYVYDSLDTIIPAYIISTDMSSCAIKKYKTGHTYGIRVFEMYTTRLSDSSINVVDSTRINLPYGVVYFYSDTVINYALGDSTTISIPASPYEVFDNSLGYYICVNPADSFTIQIKIYRSDVSLLVLPDGYSPQFKIRFFSYASPLITEKVCPTPDSLKISWNEVVGDSVKGYRIYIRDYMGVPVDSLDVDTGDTIAAFKGNLLSTVKNAQIALGNVSVNNPYKINIATRSSIGPGSIDSSYILDITDTSSTGLKLPYAYFSTYTTPPSRAGDTLLGVKGGIFLMGETWKPADASFCPGAEPIHEVIVSSFYLSKYEVTCASYAAFLNTVKDSITVDTTNPVCLMYRQVKIADTSKETWYIVSDSGVYKPKIGKENVPVVSLYWHGAAAYCNWLSEQDSLLANCYDSIWELHLSNNGYRLPTEAEFEYAASGAFTGNKQRFPWGYAWDNTKASVDGDSIKAVGSYGAYHGFCDLVGSAMEYVSDWSDDLTGLFLDSSSYYVTSALQGIVINPVGPERKTGYRHMLRGGSFASEENECVTYCRFTQPPSGRLNEYGFRIARTVQ